MTDFATTIFAAAAIAGSGAADAQPTGPAAAAPAAAERTAGPDFLHEGAPELTAGGWTINPFGRVQYDFGTVDRPGGLANPDLGWGSEFRRARLGVEVEAPRGFGLKVEADFAGDEVEVTDALISYQASDAIEFTVGQHNNFQSLEELTSSRFTSFLERAAFTDAFNFERRVGASATWKSGPVRVSAGVFGDNVHDWNDGDAGTSIDGRAVVSPKVGATQLHFGASAHFRDTGGIADSIRYRQRPQVHFTDTRFVATPSLAVGEETSWGVEAAAIRGRFHAAAELHWLESELAGGAASPTFFGGYAEIGLFLTDDSRGYRSGKFDRTRVSAPLGRGGWGALQLNARYDRLDLNSGAIRGGTQDAWLASLVWIPTSYVRFLVNYGRLSYEDAAIPTPSGDRDYSVDMLGVRAQIDF